MFLTFKNQYSYKQFPVNLLTVFTLYLRIKIRI